MEKFIQIIRIITIVAFVALVSNPIDGQSDSLLMMFEQDLNTARQEQANKIREQTDRMTSERDAQQIFDATLASINPKIVNANGVITQQMIDVANMGGEVDSLFMLLTSNSNYSVLEGDNLIYQRITNLLEIDSFSVSLDGEFQVSPLFNAVQARTILEKKQELAGKEQRIKHLTTVLEGSALLKADLLAALERYSNALSNFEGFRNEFQGDIIKFGGTSRSLDFDIEDKKNLARTIQPTFAEILGPDRYNSQGKSYFESNLNSTFEDISVDSFSCETNKSTEFLTYLSDDIGSQVSSLVDSLCQHKKDIYRKRILIGQLDRWLRDVNGFITRQSGSTVIADAQRDRDIALGILPQGKTYVERAQELIDENRYQEAMRLLSRSISVNIDVASATRLQGTIALAQEDWQEAGSIYKRLKTMDSDLAELLLNEAKKATSRKNIGRYF